MGLQKRCHLLFSLTYVYTPCLICLFSVVLSVSLGDSTWAVRNSIRKTFGVEAALPSLRACSVNTEAVALEITTNCRWKIQLIQQWKMELIN